MCLQNYWQFILHLCMTSMHLRKQSTISSSHNPTRHQLSEAESNGTTTCEKPDHILKKNNGWLWVFTDVMTFTFSSFILLQRSCLKQTNKMKQVSDSRQTLTGRIRKAAGHQNGSYYFIVIVIIIIINTLIQGSTVHLNNAYFWRTTSQTQLESAGVHACFCDCPGSPSEVWSKLESNEKIGSTDKR